MKLSEHKELKKEILSLPSKEKDKLLLRLIAKDKVLTEHLHFLLLEDETNLQERVQNIKEEILNRNQDPIHAKEVLITLRKHIKLVNHFFKVTKSSFEEVQLRIFLLNQTPLEFRLKISSAFKNYDQLFGVFFVKSVLATFKKFSKLHEDLQYDLREEMNELLEKSFSPRTEQFAEELGLPKSIYQ